MATFNIAIYDKIKPQMNQGISLINLVLKKKLAGHIDNAQILKMMKILINYHAYIKVCRLLMFYSYSKV